MIFGPSPDFPVAKDTIFFWGGECSQWYKAMIEIDGVNYNCNEQYMMAQKARLFDDKDMFAAIMASNNPRDQKAFGRKVKGFDAAKWNEIARLVVYRANLAKFAQNPSLKAWLLQTGKREIVEASPEDRVWGIGLGENDDRIWDRAQWRGTNWLGLAIMQVRSDIRAIEEHEFTE